MIPHIQGLHHVTAFAGPAPENNAFFTDTLGLRRVKTTVNFDNPYVYHLYFGDKNGTPGTVMTHFPDRKWSQGHRGTGEVAITAFAVPRGSLGDWEKRLTDSTRVEVFGEAQLRFPGPDGETLALVESDDTRTPWTALPKGMAIRGFHSVTLMIADPRPTLDLLTAMGYAEAGNEGTTTRLTMDAPVGVIDVMAAPDMPKSVEGAGSVHHIAFATANDESLLAVREAVIDAGMRPTEVRDRNYFHSIYFREPGGVLFEVATLDIGFDADEPVETLGDALKLPSQHEHLRSELVKTLEPIDGLDLS
ncbi:VOC family protein [Maritimibacter sp. UBA3975]|uniref:VOC family protein n=1 Tax=Maritimibacter sp. UBA3975 TaxID=1946833 RepID=UPI000C08DCD6|nr:VOC family protein [Maritimibacter sp. UBA3975]MAM62475.1 dioxygenase [Maritimibacter sp.]|tara:strand:+ start:15631 stop:16545 length:915 start_codon:yes stop_codon:yes gene_type:complete